MCCPSGLANRSSRKGDSTVRGIGCTAAPAMTLVGRMPGLLPNAIHDWGREELPSSSRSHRLILRGRFRRGDSPRTEKSLEELARSPLSIRAIFPWVGRDGYAAPRQSRRLTPLEAGILRRSKPAFQPAQSRRFSPLKAGVSARSKPAFQPVRGRRFSPCEAGVSARSKPAFQPVRGPRFSPRGSRRSQLARARGFRWCDREPLPCRSRA
jgi:hypothetical protein